MLEDVLCEVVLAVLTVFGVYLAAQVALYVRVPPAEIVELTQDRASAFCVVFVELLQGSEDLGKSFVLFRRQVSVES